MNNLRAFTFEILIRYICAISIGLLFEWITGRFINHLGMLGTTMLPALALFMVIAIPVWQISAKLLSKRISGAAAEMITAPIIALLIIQPLYLPMYYSNVVLPTVIEATKLDMFIWYIATTSNVMMATLTALLFLALSRLFQSQHKEYG